MQKKTSYRDERSWFNQVLTKRKINQDVRNTNVTTKHNPKNNQSR
jgi:hypothetical protein